MAKMTTKRKDWKLSDGISQREGTNLVHLHWACWDYVGGKIKKNKIK